MSGADASGLSDKAYRELGEGETYEPYVAAASVQNLDISLPGIPIPGLGEVTLGVTDRDVILVRADLAAAATPVPFSLGCARYL